MAVSKKISDLEPATTLTGVELVPIVQGDQTVRTTVNDFAIYATTQVDADVSALEVRVSSLETNVAAVSVLTTFTQAGAGAVKRAGQSKMGDTISVRDFGAVGDGVTDDTIAIQSAISAAAGRTIVFPSGTYLTGAIFILNAGDVHIKGEDKYSTTIKLKADVNDHVVAYTNAFNCSIEDITLDQNRAGKTGGHGIRLGGIDGLTLCNFIVKSTHSYGIGAQAGTNKNIIINNFEIYDCGLDGIDIKDFNLNNENIIISNGIIRNYGQTASGQAGFDIRGPAVVSNMQITAQNANNVGFRLRVQTVQGRAGFGTFSNIFVDGKSVGNIGFNVEGVSNTNYTISNVVAQNINLLAVVGGTAGLIKNISATGALGSEALSIASVDTVFDGVSIDGGTLRNVDFEATATGNIFQNFVLRGVTAATQAIRIQASANNNVLADGIIEAGSSIADGATGTVIRSVQNWKTANNILSASFLVDSLGAKILNVPHGLAVTPNPEDVQVTVRIPASGATDWRFGLLQIDSSPNSTTVTIRCVVTTASATPGAVAHFVVSIRAKGS
jgi:polygalacturonase